MINFRHMAAKKTTLESLATLISKTSVSSDKKFAALAEDISSMKEDISDIKSTMPTKSDIADMATKADVRAIVRDELAPIHLKEKFENVIGFQKEIDHALERIAAIERHLGITKKIAA
jgi:hypothetical protein